MRCIFAAGGTGGHIQPAIALAGELRRARPESEILFLGGQRPQEREWITAAGFNFLPVHSSPLSGSLPRRLRAVGEMGLGVAEALRAARKFKPDAVLGFGGYTSFPPLLAGYILGRPRLLLEQNVLPGRTNRLLARLVTEVHSQWEESRIYFKGRARFWHSGNPIRRSILESLRNVPAGGRGSLLVMGGSQGSEAVNRLMVEAAPALASGRPGLEVIHLAGPKDAPAVQKAYAQAGLKADVYDYLEDMSAAYRRAALAVCRAGGTTIAELMAAGIPALLIPYPQAAEDHQTLNARAVEARGAGICLPEKETSPQRLAEILGQVFSEPEKLNALQQRTHCLAMPDAGEKIAKRLWELVHFRPSGGKIPR